MEHTEPHPGRRYPPPAFGPALTSARRHARLGLRETARRAGISPGYLSLLEHGHRSPSESVADALIHALEASGADAETILSAALPGVGRDYSPW